MYSKINIQIWGQLSALHKYLPSTDPLINIHGNVPLDELYLLVT